MSKVKHLMPVLYLCFFLIIFSLLMMYPGESSESVINAIKFCGDTVIASMFPFMVISTLFVKLNFMGRLDRYFENISYRFFKLPPCCLFVFIMSLVGGYPSGAKLVNELYLDKKINTEQASRMMCFSVCSGPGFAFGAVGVKMLNSSSIGWILFFSQVISSVILFFSLNLFCTDVAQRRKEGIVIKASFADSLIESTASCVTSVLNMCGLIVIFSCIVSLLCRSGLIETVSNFLANIGVSKEFTKSFIACILEITTGCKTAVENKMPVEFIAFFLSFCGICIHFQIFSILAIKISKLKFIIFRVISACLSFCSAKLILVFYPIEEQVFFSNTQSVSLNSSRSYICVVCFILMCVVFLVSVKEKYDIIKK